MTSRILLLVALATFTTLTTLVVHASSTANTTQVAVPAYVFAAHGAPPYSVLNANVSSAATTSPVIAGASTIDIALQIHSSNLQWDPATVHFAKSLMLAVPSASANVFSLARYIEHAAPWSVSVSGPNATVLRVSIAITSAACVDPPRRATKKGAAATELQLRVTPSMTSPRLSAPMLLPTMVRTPAASSDSASVADARRIVGVVAFCLLFVCVLVLFHTGECGAGATELLWTLQTMLAVCDSPCAKQSFFAFSEHVFWMLRTAQDARSIVPAIVHTAVILIGIAISALLGSRSTTPHRRLLHPRLGVFFIAVFLLGGVHSSMLLAIGGLPDYSLADNGKDMGGRGIGVVCLFVTLVASIGFCWSGTGSPSLLSMAPQKVEDKQPSFFLNFIWRPVSSAKRNGPIAGVYSTFAFLPRALNYLANFLPFFVAMLLHVVVVVALAIDPKNAGGCVGTLVTCLALHLTFALYTATGTNVCRSGAWTSFVSLLHFARVAWLAAALVHLDCAAASSTSNSSSSSSNDAAATALAIVALVLVLTAAVIGILAAMKEKSETNVKLKTAHQLVKPEIKVVSHMSVPGVNAAPSLPTLHPLLQSQSQSTLNVAASSSAAKKKPPKYKGLPPSSMGTGEKPQSPLSGGVEKATFESFQNSGAGAAAGGNAGSGVSSGDANAAAIAIGLDKKEPLFPTIEIRQPSQTFDAGTKTSSTAAGISSTNNNSQRPRGQSVESRLSSGSGGHEGPGKQRSPSTSFGGSVAAFCARCGLPARPSPVPGGQTICAACKAAVASASAAAGTTSVWELPAGTQLPQQSPMTGGLLRRTGGSDRMQGTSPIEMQHQPPTAGAVGTGGSTVTLPSWEAPAAPNEAARGIVQVPSWQQPTAANASANANKEEDDLDWL